MLLKDPESIADPDGRCPDILCRPVQAQLANGAYRQALALVIPLLEKYPLDVALLDHAATCYWALEDSESALRLIDLVTQTCPQNGAGWAKLGAMAVSVGDRDRAKMAFTQALKITPKSAGLLAALNRIDPFARDSRRTGLLRQLSRSAKISAADKATAFNALGRIEEAAGKTPAAFRCFAQAKALGVGLYDGPAIERHVRAQQTLFQPKPGTDPGAGRTRFVFVVGLPRSGTTLVEQILTRHPDIGTIGESSLLQDGLAQCRRDVVQTHGATGGWDWVSHITDQQLRDLRSQMGQGLPRGVVVNKLPLNCLELGFAKTVFPDARFVFLLRHPLDVGLSNFCTNFHDPHGFSKRLDWIGHLTRMVYDSVEDYAPKLGDALRMQSYRALVETPEAQIRALLDHVGVAWHDACLTPEQGGGVVRTASLTQVRDKINTAALGKWTRYERQLAPLIEALGGWDWITQWSELDQSCAETGHVGHRRVRGGPEAFCAGGLD